MLLMASDITENSPCTMSVPGLQHTLAQTQTFTEGLTKRRNYQLQLIELGGGVLW